MANPIAVPGTNVPSGAAVSPGGAQGVTGTAGAPAWTTCTSPFTIPAVGSTVSAPVVDTSWITVGEMLYVDQAGGGVGLSGILQVTAKTSNSLTLLNPTPAPAIPPADATQAGLLKQLSGNTTDFVDGTNACQNLVTAVQPTIWSATRRVFNAVGNPTMECDQKQCGNSFAVTTAGAAGPVIDRWNGGLVGTLRFSMQQIPVVVPVPGINFYITARALRITLTTAEASLGANDFIQIWQSIEGPQLRELLGDVTSASIVCRSSVANLKFGLNIGTVTGTAYGINHLCTLGAAQTWTLIPWPNIPLWTASGTWPVTPGNLGYYLGITLAAGTSATASANDTWVTQQVGAVGQSNFAASAVNSTFDIAFVQHEPGAQCSTPIDCPFTQNYDDCLRYYCKSYDYGVKPASAQSSGYSVAAPGTPTFPRAGVRWPKPMAKTPTGLIYSHVTGTVNTAYDDTSGAALAVTGADLNTTGMGALSIPGGLTGGHAALFHWTADTGW